MFDKNMILPNFIALQPKDCMISLFNIAVINCINLSDKEIHHFHPPNATANDFQLKGITTLKIL